MRCPTCDQDPGFKYCLDRFHYGFEEKVLRNLKDLYDKLTRVIFGR